MNIDKQNIYLITGASGGNQGATGNTIAKLLLKNGAFVRAFVHKTDNRSDELKDLGAEIFVGDLLDFSSVNEAMINVAHTFFTYPVQEGLIKATVNFATAAKQNKVQTIVEIGHLHCRENSPSPRTREHWQCERIFDLTGIGIVHLRAAIFFANFLAFADEMIPGKGFLRLLTAIRGKPTLFLPTGNGEIKMPFISANDVALAAANILLNPLEHHGKTYLLSAELTTVKQLIHLLETYLNKRIAYKEISEKRFNLILKSKFADNDLLVQHLTVLWSQILTSKSVDELPMVLKQIENPNQISDTLKKLINKEPATLTDDLKGSLSWRRKIKD
jgi:uncharacterized protein YbjT (DUF2867 family)